MLRLVEYSSDEEPEEKILENVKCSNPCASLPLPIEIQEMFKESVERKEDSSAHGGRIRSFPHERGVWATYVFIKYEPNPEFLEMIEELLAIAKYHDIDFDILESYHISLSKTVKLRHHWIQPFLDSLKKHLCNIFRFKLTFESLEVYENEEKTRTFLGLKIHMGYDSLLKLTKKVDICLADFQLPCFYNDPSFHMSIASCVGSKSDTVETFMADLCVLFQSYLEHNPSFRTMVISNINCKSGNKLFTIDLKSK